jgi:hypothetical protein
VYPVVFIDAILVKIRDGQVTNRPIYVVIVVTCAGERDVLGLWAGGGGEGYGSSGCQCSPRSMPGADLFDGTSQPHSCGCTVGWPTPKFRWAHGHWAVIWLAGLSDAGVRAP